MAKVMDEDRRLYYPSEFKPRTIYGLVDPRDRMVHYIGVTVDFPSRIEGVVTWKPH